MAKKHDVETKKVAQTGTVIKDLVESAGWQEVRRRLVHDVAAIRDISSLTQVDEKKLFQEVAARQIAAEILIKWLQSVEGDAEQFKNNASLLRETYEENYILRFQHQE